MRDCIPFNLYIDFFFDFGLWSVDWGFGEIYLVGEIGLLLLFEQ